MTTIIKAIDVPVVEDLMSECRSTVNEASMQFNAANIKINTELEEANANISEAIQYEFSVNSNVVALKETFDQLSLDNTLLDIESHNASIQDKLFTFASIVNINNELSKELYSVLKKSKGKIDDIVCATDALSANISNVNQMLSMYKSSVPRPPDLVTPVIDVQPSSSELPPIPE